VAEYGRRRGVVESLRRFKLFSEVKPGDGEVMLAVFTSPPYPPCCVEALRRIVQPAVLPELHQAELQPE
jgi:hypothetical protein